MTKPARERLAQLLGGSQRDKTFSTSMHADPSMLSLQVTGVGPVTLPVRAPMAKKLIAAARPAHFGQGEETLLDRSVRDTWEITPEQFTIGGLDWPRLLDEVLGHVRETLGVPKGARLWVEPHSMLVYGKGQFFLPHQDSEKDDAMIGTLVMSLPSVHTGGVLIVKHGDESAAYQAARDDLTFAAFYSDCRHEVTRVRSGYRVAITFNLLCAVDETDEAPEPAEELVQCLTEHFATRATSRYGDRDLGLPTRLVLLLDHEYSQRGLSWRKLKGVDAERASTLRAAAGQAGCEAVLALTEIQETWDVIPSRSYDYGYYDDDVDEGDFELNDLIDDDVNLTWWTTPEGGEEIALSVAHHELCAATPSAALIPYQSEYEGYMGNYGNTLERWYRRAAVVVWPRERAFAARAEADPLWALDELLARITAGESERTRADAASLAGFWPRIATNPAMLRTTLEVAAALDDPEIATMLLEPFTVVTLRPESATGLAAVSSRYGDGWTQALFDHLFGSGRWHDVQASGWITEHLGPCCDALRDADAHPAARELAGQSWLWLHREITAVIGSGRHSFRQSRLEQLAAPLASVLVAAPDPLTEDDPLLMQIAESLRGHPDEILECLIPGLRIAYAYGATGLGAITQDCVRRLSTIVARPTREPGDWSIEWSGCRCDICGTLGAFLRSPTRQHFDWPIATDGRKHIRLQIDLAELPVSHQTRRTGRPFTLMLRKTDALFTAETIARDKALAHLEWLRSLD